jgi:hypothetical protein
MMSAAHHVLIQEIASGSSTLTVSKPLIPDEIPSFPAVGGVNNGELTNPKSPTSFLGQGAGRPGRREGVRRVTGDRRKAIQAMNMEVAIDSSPSTQVVMPWEARAVTSWDPLAWVLSPEDNQDLENVAKVLEEECRRAQGREAVETLEAHSAKGIRFVSSIGSQRQPDDRSTENKDDQQGNKNRNGAEGKKVRRRPVEVCRILVLLVPVIIGMLRWRFLWLGENSTFSLFLQNESRMNHACRRRLASFSESESKIQRRLVWQLWPSQS